MPKRSPEKNLSVKEGSWLLPSGFDRERMLDMDRRLTPPRRAAFGVLALALLASGPWLGWWTIAPLAVVAVVFRVAESRAPRTERPEYVLFGAWAGSEVIIAISVALSGDSALPTLAWFAIPVVTLSARFSARGIAAGVGIALGLMAGVGFGVDSSVVLKDPSIVIAPAALVLAVAILSTALMQSDLEHRSGAVIDQLTGMLNRRALGPRVAELSEQSLLSGEPVGMIVGDVDHFKAINDSAGHRAGDAVLKDIAYLMRKRLRAFDLAYRIGGEEFLVLVPGADVQQSAALAESLREAVATTPVGDGHRVTMSFGASASPAHTPFDYPRVFARADAALYEAKRNGRDRVAADGAQPVPAPA